MTVKLTDHNGTAISDGTGKASDYASGWKEIGNLLSDGTISTQMLPGTYTFAMSYNGSSEHQSASVSGTTTMVTFQTGLFTSESGDCTNYYASGWHAFPGGGVELLPGSYTFALTGGTHQTYSVAAGGVTDIP